MNPEKYTKPAKPIWTLSNFSQQIDILLRALGFLYLYLLLRAYMWIFFVYFWLQLPVLIVIALFFAKRQTRH